MLTLLLKNWQLVVIGLLLAVLAGTGVYITLLKSQKDTLRAEKATLTTLLTESQANLVQLKNDIQAQNNAINALKLEADARLIKNAADVKTAQNTANSYKQKADDLLKQKAPVDVPTCTSANDLINREINNAHK
jgi:hypothetical protein